MNVRDIESYDGDRVVSVVYKVAYDGWIAQVIKAIIYNSPVSAGMIIVIIIAA